MFVKDKGYLQNETYPYTHSIKAQCDKTNEPIKFPHIKRFLFGSGSSKDLKVALRYGPVISYVRPFESFWSYGKEDKVHSRRKNSISYLYPVLVVGYDDGRTPYWIIKNSMGTGWGDKGYLKLSQKKEENFGVSFLFYFIEHENKKIPWE